MKDLYARIGLKPEEISEERLQAISNGGMDLAAARYVLLHPGRRHVYDRTHATLTDIGIARAALGLNNSRHWRGMTDFRRVPPAQPAAEIESTRRTWATIAVGILLAGALWVFGTQIDDVPEPRRPAPVAPRTSPWHVTTDTLNVRSAPSTAGAAIGTLHKYDTVQIEGSLDGKEWAEITYGGRKAYVATAYLAAGDGRAARNAACRAAGITRPFSGTVLKRSEERGEHHLTINASKSSDATAKLETPNGETVLEVYVRAGESAYFRTIPDGIYRFKFATGEGFSPSCGRFVDNMQAFQDDELKLFMKQRMSGGYYVTQMEYTLYDVVYGNFRPTRIDNEAY